MSTPRPDRAPRSRRPGLLLWRQALGPHLRALALVASGAVLLASLPAVGRAAARAAVVVSPTGPVRGVTPALFGLNGVDTTGPAWSSKKLQAALAGFFGAGVLRYPGGTAANYWSWRDGWFQP